ncbi:MAG: hypothetical protein MJA31_17790 [Clostridia bacterium]|nr:hypothetical protein [Clostridia bacterium]
MLEVEIVQGMNSYLNGYGIRYSNEVRMGIGIPDITFNIGANSKIKRLDDYNMLAILSYLQNKKTATYEQIVDYFNIKKARVRQYIICLVNMSLVKVKKEVIRIVKNIFDTKLGTIISIEAKLKDWKNGFLQAQRYLCFSDYSYLALPNDKIKNVDLELLQEKGIGLLSVEKDELVEILKPKQSECCDYNLKYIITSEILNSNNSERRRRKDKIFSEYAV